MPRMESNNVVIGGLGRGVREVETKVPRGNTLLITLPAKELEGVSR